MSEVKVGMLPQPFGIVCDDFDAQFAPYAMRSQHLSDG
jgi:hypothetical protein